MTPILSQFRAIAILVAASWMVCAPPFAHATAIAFSGIGFSSLSIDPASGDIVFGGLIVDPGTGKNVFSESFPWPVFAGSFASNSDNESVSSGGRRFVGGPVSLINISEVPYARGEGAAIDRTRLPLASTSATSDVDIPGCKSSAGLAGGFGGITRTFIRSQSTGSGLVMMHLLECKT